MALVDFPALFAFYGTLRRGGGAAVRLGLEHMEWAGRCRIRGELYVVSWYPALASGAGDVVGDLFRVADAATVAVLDRFEGFDPAHPDESLYVRELVTLADPETEAWLYVWNGSTRGLARVPGGDWLAHEGAP